MTSTTNTNDETIRHGAAAGIRSEDVDTCSDMEAFDRLPRRLRDWLNSTARIDWNVRGLLGLFENLDPRFVELQVDQAIAWMSEKEDAFCAEERGES